MKENGKGSDGERPRLDEMLVVASKGANAEDLRRPRVFLDKSMRAVGTGGAPDVLWGLM